MSSEPLYVQIRKYVLSLIEQRPDGGDLRLPFLLATAAPALLLLCTLLLARHVGKKEDVPTENP